MCEGVLPGCVFTHLTVVVGAGFVTVPPASSFWSFGEQGRAGELEDCLGWNHQSLEEDVSDSWIAHHLAFLFSGW